MNAQSMSLVLLFLGALAGSTPAAAASCPRGAYEVEKYAQTIGRSSRASNSSKSGSCRIGKSAHGLSLEAIPSMSPPTRCRFVIFGDAPLGNGWRIQAFAVDTTSNDLVRQPPNKFELQANDAGEVEQALISMVTFTGPRCDRWREAFGPVSPADDPTP